MAANVGAALPPDSRGAPDRSGRPWTEYLEVLLLGLCLALATSIVSGVGSSRDVRAATAPAYTLSDYVTSLNYSAWYSYGCSQVKTVTGHGLSTISVILDFGQPTDTGGQYGTTLLESDTFAVWDDDGLGIRAEVVQFLYGYWECHTSSSPMLTLMIGDSSIYSSINTTTDTNAYWMGEVIAAEDTWLNGNGISTLEYAEGGSDSETEYASYSYTANYLTKAYDNDGGVFIYDFGDAGGCPKMTHAYNGPCNGGWTQGQVLDISWQEIYALPLPEIYNTEDANAKQWYQLSLLSIADGDKDIAFQGELTQATACAQKDEVGCSGTNNSASTGWGELYTIIWNDTNTRPGDIMIWSDDIQYLPYSG